MGRHSSQVTHRRLGGGGGCVVGDTGRDGVVMASSLLATWDAGGDVVIGDMGCEKVVVASLSLVKWDARGWRWCRRRQ